MNSLEAEVEALKSLNLPDWEREYRRIVELINREKVSDTWKAKYEALLESCRLKDVANQNNRKEAKLLAEYQAVEIRKLRVIIDGGIKALSGVSPESELPERD